MSNSINSYNLPWVEKYRPNKLNDIKGQNKIVESLTNIIENNSFPHLLFYGGSGSGKTSVILSIIEQYYGKKKKLMVMRLDASDDRGINSVRDEIKAFAEKKNYFQSGIKVIILDEPTIVTLLPRNFNPVSLINSKILKTVGGINKALPKANLPRL